MIPPFSSLARFFWLTQIFGLPAPAISSAGVADAPQLSALHAQAFRRGWSVEEFERLLIEPNVIADRAMADSELAGFVLSRIAAEEAEILSIAVAPAYRGQGVARRLLDVHLRRLAGYRVNSLFLEVDERNAPARRLYGRLGFAEVGRRNSYYAQETAAAAAALVLRRTLT